MCSERIEKTVIFSTKVHSGFGTLISVSFFFLGARGKAMSNPAKHTWLQTWVCLLEIQIHRQALCKYLMKVVTVVFCSDTCTIWSACTLRVSLLFSFSWYFNSAEFEKKCVQFKSCWWELEEQDTNVQCGVEKRAGVWAPVLWEG